MLLCLIPSRRACAIKVCTSSGLNVLLVCLYIPCDNYSKYVINNEYEDVMNSVECSIASSNCQGIILCGDLKFYAK